MLTDQHVSRDEKTFIVGAPLVETLTAKLWATLGGKVISGEPMECPRWPQM